MNEARFVEMCLVELHIGRGIFQQYLALQGVLNLIYMCADPLQGAQVIAQRQQVVEKMRPVAGPGQMF